MTLVSGFSNVSIPARWFSPSRLPALMSLPANVIMLLGGLEAGRTAYLLGGFFGATGCLAILRWADKERAPAHNLFQAMLPWHDSWRFSGILSLISGISFGLLGLSGMRVDEIIISCCTILGASLLLLPERPAHPAPQFNRLAFNYVYHMVMKRPTRASALAYCMVSSTILISGALALDIARAFSGLWFMTSSILQGRVSKWDTSAEVA